MSDRLRNRKVDRFLFWRKCRRFDVEIWSIAITDMGSQSSSQTYYPPPVNFEFFFQFGPVFEQLLFYTEVKAHPEPRATQPRSCFLFFPRLQFVDRELQSVFLLFSLCDYATLWLAKEVLTRAALVIRRSLGHHFKSDLFGAFRFSVSSSGLVVWFSLPLYLIPLTACRTRDSTLSIPYEQPGTVI